MTLSILALIFITGFASASGNFSVSDINKPSSLNPGIGAFDITFNLTNSNLINSSSIDWNNSTVKGGNAKFLSFSPNRINNNTSLVATVKVTFDKSYVGVISGEVYVNNCSIPFSVRIKIPEKVESCLSAGNQDNLEVGIEDISVIGYGGKDKDTDWFPLDNVQVEVNIKNTADYKLRGVVVRWGLYNLKENYWVFDNKENDFNLRSGDDKTLYLNFKLNKPKEFKGSISNDNYEFFVWADGENPDGNKTCASIVPRDPVKIIADENNFVVLNNVQLDGVSLDSSGTFPQQVSCGTKLHLTADVWNVGEDDQKDVSLRIYNKDLGVDGTINVGDIDAFEKKTVSFDLPVIPQGIDEKWYPLELGLYDEDNYIYQDDYNDDKSLGVALLNIAGNCVLPKGTLTANLDSGGKAGKELVIRATITNSGKEVTNYSLSPSGYSDWATLETVSPSDINIEPGKTADVYLTFKVDSKVSGEKLFNLDLSSQGEQVSSQPVSVSIEKSFIGNLLGNNSTRLLTYLIIGVVIILILIIIVLAIKLARK